MQWKPNVTVAALVQDDNDRYLMVEEESSTGLVFNQPAGHLEKGESLIDAVRREVMEETAYQFEPEHIIGIYMYPNRAKNLTYMRVAFYGHVLSHYPEQELDEGIIRAPWMTREELLQKPEKLRSIMVMKTIDDYLQNKSYPLDILTYSP